MASGCELFRSNDRRSITIKNPGKLSNHSIACATADIAAVGILNNINDTLCMIL